MSTLHHPSRLHPHLRAPVNQFLWGKSIDFFSSWSHKGKCVIFCTWKRVGCYSLEEDIFSKKVDFYIFLAHSFLLSSWSRKHTSFMRKILPCLLEREASTPKKVPAATCWLMERNSLIPNRTHVCMHTPGLISCTCRSSSWPHNLSVVAFMLPVFSLHLGHWEPLLCWKLKVIPHTQRQWWCFSVTLFWYRMLL